MPRPDVIAVIRSLGPTLHPRRAELFAAAAQLLTSGKGTSERTRLVEAARALKIPKARDLERGSFGDTAWDDLQPGGRELLRGAAIARSLRRRRQDNPALDRRSVDDAGERRRDRQRARPGALGNWKR